MCEIAESFTIFLLSVVLSLSGILILALAAFIERDPYKQVDLTQQLGVTLDAVTTAGVFVTISGAFACLCAFGASHHKEVLLIFIFLSVISLLSADLPVLDIYMNKLKRDAFGT